METEMEMVPLSTMIQNGSNNGWLTTLFLIVWVASMPYRPLITVKSFAVNNFHLRDEPEYRGVSTKLLSLNCSVKKIIYNPSKFFGIHVSSTPVDVSYLEVTLATGQLEKYNQLRKSQRLVYVQLIGDRVPLYGAGLSIAAKYRSGGVPLRLQFDVKTRGHGLGKIVKTKRMHISCSFVIDQQNTNAITFQNNSCTYN